MFDLQSMNKETIINIICGVLLIGLIIVLIVCLTRRDKFNNELKKSEMQKIHENNENNGNDENDIVIFIDNPNCGFSKKMKAVLEQNGMKIGNKHVVTKNIMTDGKELSSKHNINGTPGFLHPSTGKVVMGFMPIDKLEKELNQVEKSVSDGNENGEIVIVGRDSCPFCMKLYKFLDENNISYKKVAPDSEEGNRLMKETGGTGVPISVIMNGNNVVKHKIGYHENVEFYK
jgi:glutaredoxin